MGSGSTSFKGPNGPSAPRAGELALPGSICAVKNIYQNPKSEEWLEEYPDGNQSPAESAESAKFALLIQNVKSKDPRKLFQAHSIVVQSPQLQKSLREHVFHNYPTVACDLKRVVFDEPFQPFVHCWREFTKLRRRRDTEPVAREHIALLYDYLLQELAPIIESYEDYLRVGTVSWKDAWMFFPPGCLVIGETHGIEAAFEVNYTEYIKDKQDGQLKLRLHCDFVEWNGTAFGRSVESFDVGEFPGMQKISRLLPCPLEFQDRKSELGNELRKRGEQFEALAGQHYRAYFGTAITWKYTNAGLRTMRTHVSGRVVIDVKTFDWFSPYPMNPIIQWKLRDLERFNAERQTHHLVDSTRQKLTRHHHLLCPPFVRGYSLKSKQWVALAIKDIAPITWNTNAFDRLVLPSNEKEILLTISRSQFESGAEISDVMQGKGKGVNLLLAGPPGVGKTLTAEALSEELRLPLYSISAGDLGSDANTIERRLNEAMRMVTQWKAILLLDESDIFLEARMTNDIERNGIVCVFLRCLEYYEGILFLTTNRPTNIDPAFLSRIHLMLKYPDLDQPKRRQIWCNLLDQMAPSHVLSAEDIQHLSGREISGRQIKNILKMSQLMALRKEESLTRRVVDMVMEIEQKWLGPTEESEEQSDNNALVPSKKALKRKHKAKARREEDTTDRVSKRSKRST